MPSDVPSSKPKPHSSLFKVGVLLLLACATALWPQLASAATPPVITTQPEGSTNLTATEVIFSVVATGSEPLHYQWYFNITNRLSGEISESLIYTNVGAFQEGFFSVVITNVAGAVTSNPVFLSVLIPPLVTREPTNVVVAVGGTATFSVSATGDEPLRYQWFLNIIDEIVGATNSTLTLTNVQKADSGSYQIEVSNDHDTVNSAEVFLTVKDPPIITAAPASVSVPFGSVATFSVALTGDGPFAYQWFFNQTNALFGANSNSLVIANAQLANAGNYMVRIATDVGTVTSPPASLIVQQAPTITVQPVSIVSVLGSNAAFAVTAIGSNPLSYQWYFNRTNPVSGATQSTLTLSSLQLVNAGIYSVAVVNPSGSVTSINASLTVFLPPQITTAPTSLTIRAGQPAVFNVVATGTAPLTYRWFFTPLAPPSLPVQIAGASSSSFTLSSVQIAHAGTYSVTVSNLAGVAASAPALLTVQSPPVIVQQPVSRAVLPGGSATFTVQAVGDAPLTYQWLYNTSSPIAGATTPELIINNAQSANAGRYSVRITNALGTTISIEATLAVKLPPTISQQPISLTVTQGNTASFSVTVAGDGPFFYRWLLNGTNAVPGTNGAILQLPNVQSALAGNYSVVVTNEVGSATSSDAPLIVRTPPAITQQPASLFAAPGSSATFTVVATGDQPLTYQWLFNTTNTIASATNAALIVPNISLAAGGLYSVILSNELGIATSSSASLRVRNQPVVTAPPASLTVTQGQAATFTVQASGDGPFAFQWFFNTTEAIVGATASSLTLNNILPSAAGPYSVRISNLVGSVLSSAATLTVRPLPVITQKPVSLVVTQGQSAAFTVIATSGTPLTYQWRRNGLALAGNAATFTINAALESNAGTYDVIVGNTYGSITSSVASLTVFGLDFGDAPQALYPTTLAGNGARHVIVPGIHLGLLIDAEADAQTSSAGNGDDITGAADEDGVRFIGSLHLGRPTSIEVIASTNGFLNAWIDFNHADGWAQANEHVLADVALHPGTNFLSVITPVDATLSVTMARFRFSSVTNLAVTGQAPDGEVEDHPVTVAAAADLVLTQSSSATEVLTGNNASLSIHATNAGPSLATGVILTHRLSARSTFVSATSSQGACAHLNGIVTCNMGSLAVGAGVSVAFTTSIGQGTNTSVTTVLANEFDPTPANASAASSIVGTSTTPQFANSEIIIMPLPDAGVATPYPAGILVSGVTAAVHQVTVTLRGLNHDYPDDIDMLLVGPQGQAVVLMSDAGFDNPILDATITFDDMLGQPLPDSVPAISSGRYASFNFFPFNDLFPAPAPAGPFTADLSAFRGTDPNGVWSLYVVDDSLDNGGSDVPGFISDGWTLNIVTADLLANLGVTATASPASVTIGGLATYSVTVTNHGPTTAAAVCQSVLPSALSFISASTPQGACCHSAGVVTCNLGNIAPDASVTFNVVVTASIGGSMTNVFTVTGSQLDRDASNNSAAAMHFVQPLVNLAVSMSPPASPVLLSQPILCSVALTNYGPNTATGVWLTNVLPAGATYLSFSASQGSCSANGQTVLCSLNEVAAGATASVTFQFAPGNTGVNSNYFRVVATEKDSSPGNNTAASLFSVHPAIDLSITSASASSPIPLKQDYVVMLSVTNRGQFVVNPTVTDRLPATTTFISAFTTRGGCTNEGGHVRCDLLNLVPGEGASIILRARTDVLGSLTNVATVSGSLPDYNPANNSVMNFATVAPNASLALGISDRPSPLWLGDNLTYLIAATNFGPTVAGNVTLTNLLPAGVAFVSATSSQGSCTRSGDLVRCDLGTMAANAVSTITITTRPVQSGWVTNRAVIVSSIADAEPADNTVSTVTRVISATVNPANATPVATPLLGLANPYPSTIIVSGVSSAIFRVRVTLLNLSHTRSDDLDILLVGPDGRSTLLMSDCGGEFGINAATLTFDDGATNALGDFSSITTGTVRPSNFGAEPDGFAAPAPNGPYATNLSIFNGTDPNGTWSLYIMDDSDRHFGTLAGGWRLSISAFEPMADLGLAQTASPNPVATGSNVVFSYTVTNQGPSMARNVRLTNTFPAALTFKAFTNANGACTLTGGILVCELGSILPAGSASFTVAAASLIPGTFTNRALVGFDGVDLRPTNNVSSLAITFDVPPVITLQPISQTTTVGASVQFTAAATGAAPLAYRWQKDGVDVPGATGLSLSVNGITLATAGSYRLRVSNAVGVALSDAAFLLIPGAPTISTIANRTIDEDTDTGAIPFVIQDFDTQATTLALSAISSNPALVPTSGMVFGGSGQNRTLRVTPAANLSGTATIAVRVLDTTGASATNVFNLVVRPAIDPIVILVQPRNYLSVTGSAVNLTITATSSLPLSYQWQRNGQALPGATLATFSIVNVRGTNAGDYRVIVSNADTNLTSVTASLAVTNQLPSPNILSISQSGSNATVTFTTVVGLSYTLEYKSSFSDASWTPLGTVPGTGSNRILNDSAATVPTRFYRIHAD